ncbi:two-component system response regulator [Corynebacterium urealyticum DSM 7109]|uniref:Two-component system response regulator n=1 Tax=Corynebacterium urealyticum (strain ATCC 43042 / DSM 7109) TaxID=504474 RepID=B1VH01_CORU7|nr:two-component system response regulator [Corynebacterium urealyticum DSM 7109]
MTTIRVLLAEDQSLVRGALVALLSAEPDIEVIAECATGTEALRLVQEHPIDVALLDIEMPGLNGLDVAKELSGHPCRCLIVTTFGKAGYVKRAMESGVDGFIVKDTPPEELADTIRRVHAGLRVIDPTLARDSLLAPDNPLSDRETQVCQQLFQGKKLARHRQGPAPFAGHRAQSHLQHYLEDRRGKPLRGCPPGEGEWLDLARCPGKHSRLGHVLPSLLPQASPLVLRCFAELDKGVPAEDKLSPGQLPEDLTAFHGILSHADEQRATGLLNEVEGITAEGVLHLGNEIGHPVEGNLGEPLHGRLAFSVLLFPQQWSDHRVREDLPNRGVSLRPFRQEPALGLLQGLDVDGHAVGRCA